MRAKRNLKNTEQDRPRGNFTAQSVRIYAFRVKELPHLTFYGKTKWEALNHLKSELTRLNPQGFDLEFDSFEDRVFDMAKTALEAAEQRETRH